jgi:hypothetical protein
MEEIEEKNSIGINGGREKHLRLLVERGRDR